MPSDYSHLRRLDNQQVPNPFKLDTNSLVFVGQKDGFPTDVISAYEVAVKNGFEGTEEDWLLSLIGPQGEKGLGWTGVTYDPATGILTFTSDQGLGYSTTDIRGGQGPQGIQGEVGPQGPQGEVGPGGPQGIQGLQGDTGPEGPQGIQGEIGPQGAQGVPGIDGSGWTGASYDPGTGIVTFISDDGLGFSTSDLRGAQGPQGIQGPQGAQGETGPQGPQGIQGDTGAQGPQGLQGLQGIDGDSAYQVWLDTGNVGTESDFLNDITGPQGPQGTQGIQGIQGEVGPEGPQGIQGLKGDTGDTGPQGVQGIQGVQGLDGYSAYQVWLDEGNVGTEADFITDITGPQGPQGLKGDTGDQGLQGVQGIQGEVGPAGVDGTGWTGASYDSGTGIVTFTSDDGLGFSTTDLRGATGPQGIQGEQGIQGIQGEPGADGLGWTAGAYDAGTGRVTFTSTDGLGFVTGDLRGAQGPQGETGPQGAGVSIQGSDTYANILLKPAPEPGDLWIQTDAAGGGVPGDGIAWDGSQWTNVGPVRGPTGLTGAQGPQGVPGTDGLGWTGASYDAGTGVVTFVSTDGLGFVTGDLRGATGAQGEVGPQGAPGTDGLGWTGASYDAGTGVVTFASDDGLGFTTADLRGAQGSQGLKGDTGDTGPAGADGLGWTGASYDGGTGIVTFASTDGLGFATGDLRGATGPQGVQCDPGADGTSTSIQGSDTYENIIAIPSPSVGDIWIQINAGGGGVAGDGLSWSGASWVNIGPIRGPIGPAGSDGATGAAGSDGLGWTGASYDAGTGVVTFTSTDGLGFATGDLRGAQGEQGIQGNPGADGADGLGWTGGSYDAGTGVVTFTSTDGLGFTTADLRGATGAQGPEGPQGIQGSAGTDGLGWTGVTYSAATGQVTFTSDDGLDFVTGDLRGSDGATGPQGPQGDPGPAGADGAVGPAGADGLGWTGASYDAGTGIVTFTSTDGLGFATGDLRGADGAQGPQGDPGPAGADGEVGIVKSAIIPVGGEELWIDTSQTIFERELPLEVSATTHTLVSAEERRLIRFSNAGAVTVDISPATFVVGDWFLLYSLGAGGLTLDTTGMIVEGSPTLAISQYEALHVEFTGIDTIAVVRYGGSGGGGDVTIAKSATTPVGGETLWLDTDEDVVGLEAPAEITGVSHTLSSSDLRRLSLFSNAAAVTVTVPTGTFSPGEWFALQSTGEAGLSLDTTGITLNGDAPFTSIATNEVMTVMFTAADTISVVGGSS